MQLPFNHMFPGDSVWPGTMRSRKYTSTLINGDILVKTLYAVDVYTVANKLPLTPTATVVLQI